ncbi:MAG: hypothetical protein R2717_01660 [Schumannella sp.]
MSQSSPAGKDPASSSPESAPAASSASSASSAAGASAAADRPAKVMPKGSSTSLLFTLAVLASSLVVAVPVTVSRIAEGILDSVNPDRIKDTGAGLAYLGPILGWGFGSLGVLLVVVIALYLLIYRRERTLDALKLPLLVVAVQIVLGVIAIIFNGFAN